jgi:16S rRNA (cytosine1402-N4)-methyltransferase
MHIPVLKNEVLHFLNPKPGENFIDCTGGEGGYSEAILEKNSPNGLVLAFEWDEEVYEALKKKENERFVVINESYTTIKDVVQERKISPVSGVVFDLGFSSFHIDESKRGFSFMRDELLDMRYSKNNPVTAYDVVNKYKEKDLLYILKKWGEEDFFKEVARKIVTEREKLPIETTQDLVKVIDMAIPDVYKKKQKINFATKTFQAIRIAVNGEILAIEHTLPEALDVLEEGGRLVVVCFHGGEEKVVRSFFKNAKIKLLTESPVTPSQEEVFKNFRSRSAKLYAGVKK